MNRKLALITGASVGLGKALAGKFADGGYDVVLTARREPELRTLAEELGRHVSAHVIPADLGTSEGPASLVAELTRRNLTVDVLVNNAGYGVLGDFSTTELDGQLGMIRLNIEALTHLTHLLLPGMLARRSGGILNIASTAAFQPGPGMAVYFATKSYVLSFSMALAEEVKGSGVTVTCLCPGPTETEFADRAGIQKTRLFRGNVMKVDDVARIGYEAFAGGRDLAIAGFQNKLSAFATRLVPISWSRKVAGALLD